MTAHKVPAPVLLRNKAKYRPLTEAFNDKKQWKNFTNDEVSLKNVTKVENH